MKIQLFLLIIILTSIISFNLRKTKNQHFDSYVFALQWPNGYCKVFNCESSLEKMEKNIMNIHGLWPSLKTGASLRECTKDIQVIDEENSELFQNMRKYWPSFRGSNTEFWNHEYNKHGYCMVQEYGWDDYEDFFTFVIHLYLKDYKYLIQKAFPIEGEEKIITLTFEEIQEKIRKIIPNATFKINCSQGYLYEFYFYLEKDFKPSPNSRYSNICKSVKLIFK